MKVTVNGKEAGTKETGCALCGATWGSYYEVIDGHRLFFCCDLCAKGFREIVDGMKSKWGPFDELTISGNYSSGRHCIAKIGNKEHKVFVRFTDSADIEVFREEL